jgi:hypothetical protein
VRSAGRRGSHQRAGRDVRAAGAAWPLLGLDVNDGRSALRIARNVPFGWWSCLGSSRPATAFPASTDPSDGIKMCVNMERLRHNQRG